MSVVLITGASSGIGEALAREYVRRGSRVVLVARRAELLEALCAELGGESRAIAVAGDVTKDGELERAVARAVERFGGLDVVVANAGGGVTKPFTRLRLEDFQRQIDLNLYGVLRAAFAALPELQKSRGRFVVVTSVMAYLPLPAASPYNVSKAAAMALAESLRVDLAPHEVSVTNVAPGFIDTPLRRVDAQGKRDAAGKDPVPKWLQMPAHVAARKIARAAHGRRRELVLTGHGKLGVFFGRHFSWLASFVLSRAAKRV